MKNVLLDLFLLHYLIFTYRIIPNHTDIKSEVLYYFTQASEVGNIPRQNQKKKDVC